MITSLMNFRDLTGEAVIQARQCVINAEIEAAREKVIHARSLFEAGIHNVVNGSSGIKAAAAHFLVIKRLQTDTRGNDSNLLIVFYVQIMPDDFVMQLHRF